MKDTHLELYPPVFSTPLDLYFKDRKERAQRLSMEDPSGSGKLWCWHDYTFLAGHYPQDVLEYMGGLTRDYRCIKCGKRKLTNDWGIVESIPTPVLDQMTGEP